MKLETILKNLRKEKGLSQEELAKETGLSFHAINSYESGRRTPNSKAMVALERYFQVSGEYLRGESDERLPEYAWDDSEIMDAVHDNLSTLLKKLERALRSCPDQEQNLAFDILVELRHVLGLKNIQARSAGVALLHDAFFASTRFVDVCISSRQDAEDVSRVEQTRQAATAQFDQALEDAKVCLSD